MFNFLQVLVYLCASNWRKMFVTKNKNNIVEIEGDEISSFVEKLEQTFQIQFNAVKILERQISVQNLTFLIVEKIGFEDSKHCTSQAVFYKLRKEFQKYSNDVVPSTALEILLPEKERKQRIKELSNIWGVDLKILKLPKWANIILY